MAIIVERLRPLKVRVRTLPGLLEMGKGQVDYSAFLDLDIDDLLARAPPPSTTHESHSLPQGSGWRFWRA